MTPSKRNLYLRHTLSPIKKISYSYRTTLSILFTIYFLQSKADKSRISSIFVIQAKRRMSYLLVKNLFHCQHSRFFLRIRLAKNFKVTGPTPAWAYASLKYRCEVFLAMLVAILSGLLERAACTTGQNVPYKEKRDDTRVTQDTWDTCRYSRYLTRGHRGREHLKSV